MAAAAGRSTWLGSEACCDVEGEQRRVIPNDHGNPTLLAPLGAGRALTSKHLREWQGRPGLWHGRHIPDRDEQDRRAMNVHQDPR